tara:strand:+ start:1444 stop:1626 length:183 start_codon:yes stop_codon:yes gene_type:complete
MKYLLIIISLIFLTCCSSNTAKNKNLFLNMDIYTNDMTYEKFKQYALEYAKKSTFPSLSE